MPTSWSSLYLGFSAGMTDYIARHIANYSRIQTCLDYLYAISGGGRSMLDVPLGLQEIFDRNGIIGKASYKPPSGTKTGPDYNLVVPRGAWWNGSTFFMKGTSTTIALNGYSTDTYYISIDAAGNPYITSSPSSLSVWQFDWSTSTHQVTNVTRYSGVAILFDGDDYNDALSSSVFGVTFESLAERFEYVEGALGGISDHLAYDPTSTGLNFKYKAGKVRNDNVIWTVVAGTLALTDNDVNYIEVDPADGTVSSNLVGFTIAKVPLYEVTTASGAMTVITDKRAWLGAGGGGGGGGHTQNTDVGTTSSEFKLNMGVTGAPSANALFKVERGTSPDVAFRWNETTDKWEYTNDGTTWNNLGELAIDLGAQVISKYVAVDDPALVHEEIGRGSSLDYEEIDLSSQLAADAPDGVAGVVLRVVYWDTEDPATISSFVSFRKGGIGSVPVAAYTLFSPALINWSRPQTLVLGVSTDYKIEFNMTASGADTSNIRVYLVGYYKNILGVGTQEVQFTSSDNAVPANSTVDFNLSAFCNRALVHYLKLAETGGLVTGDYDIEIYANDTFDAAGLLYKAVGIHPEDDYEDWLPWWHKDGDGSSELHIRIINKDLTQAATFDITIRCEMFA